LTRSGRQVLAIVVLADAATATRWPWSQWDPRYDHEAGRIVTERVEACQTSVGSAPFGL